MQWIAVCFPLNGIERCSNVFHFILQSFKIEVLVGPSNFEHFVLAKLTLAHSLNSLIKLLSHKCISLHNAGGALSCEHYIRHKWAAGITLQSAATDDEPASVRITLNRHGKLKTMRAEKKYKAMHNTSLPYRLAALFNRFTRQNHRSSRWGETREFATLLACVIVFRLHPDDYVPGSKRPWEQEEVQKNIARADKYHSAKLRGKFFPLR